MRFTLCENMFTRRHKNNKNNSNPTNKRMDVVMAFVFIFFVAVVVRLVDLQIFKYPYYIALASGQHSIFETIIPSRGKIYVEDKGSGELYPLALNKKLYLVYAVPKQIEGKDSTEQIAKELSLLLKLSKNDIKKKIESGTDFYAPIAKKVNEETIEKIKNLNLKGIHFEKENWRYYPDNELAAHILGYVGFKDNKKTGLYGIEGFYTDFLSGREGQLHSSKDASGKLVMAGSKFMQKAEDGADVVLTIDRLVQYNAEKIIKGAVEKNGSVRGSVVIADPKTGEIIAIASYPTFNPNEYYKVKDIGVFQNPSIYNLYEAGSVIKPIVMSTALDLGLVSPQTEIIDNGSIKVDQFTIKNFDEKGNGKITMAKVLEQSSNVGMVQVGQKIGKERLYEYFKKFGFMDFSGIDLYTEASTNIKETNQWAKSDLATASFGQGFSINEMRLVAAYCALANSGKRMRMHIVKKIISPDGKEEIIYPQEVGQAISSQTAATISAMLVSVIENGQAFTAKVPGYQMAGKSGTAQVPNPSGVGYDATKRITSFIGYGPIEDPRFVISIKFDYPKGDVYGVGVAAPAFAQLAKDLFQYYQIPPTKE